MLVQQMGLLLNYKRIFSKGSRFSVFPGLLVRLSLTYILFSYLCWVLENADDGYHENKIVFDGLKICMNTNMSIFIVHTANESKSKSHLYGLNSHLSKY